MRIVTWRKLVNELSTAADNKQTKYAFVVFDPKKSKWRTTGNFLTEDGEFEERKIEYKFEDRVYTFSSKNKYFESGKLGNSLYAAGLTGPDSNGIRLSDYIGKWKMTSCYIFDDENEFVKFRENPTQSLAYEAYAATNN